MSDKQSPLLPRAVGDLPDGDSIASFSEPHFRPTTQGTPIAGRVSAVNDLLPADPVNQPGAQYPGPAAIPVKGKAGSPDIVVTFGPDTKSPAESGSDSKTPTSPELGKGQTVRQRPISSKITPPSIIATAPDPAARGYRGNREAAPRAPPPAPAGPLAPGIDPELHEWYETTAKTLNQLFLRITDEEQAAGEQERLWFRLQTTLSRCLVVLAAVGVVVCFVLQFVTNKSAAAPCMFAAWLMTYLKCAVLDDIPLNTRMHCIKGIQAFSHDPRLNSNHLRKACTLATNELDRFKSANARLLDWHTKVLLLMLGNSFLADFGLDLVVIKGGFVYASILCAWFVFAVWYTARLRQLSTYRVTEAMNAVAQATGEPKLQAHNFGLAAILKELLLWFETLTHEMVVAKTFAMND